MPVRNITSVMFGGDKLDELYVTSMARVKHPAVHDLFQQEAEIQSALQKFLRRRLAKMPRVREAYIFGSVARGESRTGSDIDVALVIRQVPVAATWITDAK